MRYLNTAFAQLGFAIKLMQAAEEGLLDLEAIDRPLTIAEGASILVLPDHIMRDRNDLINACQNLVGVVYGAAAITLNRCREEASTPLPDPILSEVEQWCALVYHIRNAFAHDIAEPRWDIRKERFRREYKIGPVAADLRQLHGAQFQYDHVGGPEGLFHLMTFGEDHAFGRL